MSTDITRGEQCLTVSRDGYVCTKEKGHSISSGHYGATETGDLGWVDIPDCVTPGETRCTHGRVMVYDPAENPLPMAAPSFFCICCLRVTFYLASSSASFNPRTGESHGRTTAVDTTLCNRCGGKTRTEDW